MTDTQSSYNRFHETYDREWRNISDKASSPFRARLERFGGHFADDATVHSAYTRITRGVALLRAAGAWGEPTLGTKEETDTDQARGTQWRLAVAYAGFEIFAKGVLALEGHESPVHTNTLRRLLSNLTAPPEFRPLSKASGFEATATDERYAELTDFLSLYSATSVAAFSTFAREGVSAGAQGVDGWMHLVQLSAAFRHMTVHGALSASRAKTWGLDETFTRLVEDLDRVVAATLDTLTSDI